MTTEPEFLIGVDVGGTFTDAVVCDITGVRGAYKAFTTPGSEAEGVLAALEKAASSLGTSLAELLSQTGRFVHGSTIAPNALIEKKGAKTGFVTTKGFRDTLVMRRMLRENMYDLRARVPESFLRREWILEAAERVNRDGDVLEPLSQQSIDDLVKTVRDLELDAVGICLLFSFRFPSHERRIRDALVSAIPGIYAVASVDIAPEIRDYERASTTALTAYLGPKVATYLRDLDGRLRHAGLRCELQVMGSNGGVCTVDEAIAQPVDMLLSGPAGGVVGAMKMAGLDERPDLLTFDLGGTSCDLSVVREGRAVSSTFLPRHTRFEGWDVLRPFLDIHALGAGGGSIAWADAAGGLHVGPRSAGAVPGPACYDKGGTEPTVSDADLVLGYLNPDYFLGSEVQLDVEAAEAALGALAERCGYDRVGVAAGVFDIVNAAMADRIRVVLADSGADPRDFTLLCFGGAGGLHAPAIMADLRLRRVIVPRLASTFSAYGLLLSDVRHDLVRTLGQPLSTVQDIALAQAFGEMQTDATHWLAAMPAGMGGAEPVFTHSADLRYSGQSHELRVVVGESGGSAGEIAARFETVYDGMYGYTNERSLIELVNIRLVAEADARKPPQTPENGVEPHPDAPIKKGARDAYFRETGQWMSAPVYVGESLHTGDTLVGPAILELPSTTIVVRPGQRYWADQYANIIIEGVASDGRHES